MTQPIRNILRDLDNIRESLLAFSDDVWLGIDHNDTSAMKAGIAFKEKLNAQLDALTLGAVFTSLSFVIWPKKIRPSSKRCPTIPL